MNPVQHRDPRNGEDPWRSIAFACLLMAFTGSSSEAIVATQSDDLIGEIQTIRLNEGSTLLDVARRFDLGYVDIRAANPTIDPWLPGSDASVLVPTEYVLPAAPRRGIVINLAELRLYYFPAKSAPAQTFPIGIGSSGIETPVGETAVIRKATNPTWYPPPSIRAEDPDLPESVPPGPNNPMGDYALYLGWKGYAVHGTNKPWGVGRRVSHGCIRLYPEDIARLFPQVTVGTPVTVVDQPMKLGWHAGELYLEIHPTQAQADQIEAGETVTALPVLDLEGIVAKAAGAAVARIDWAAVETAEVERTGVPGRITRPEQSP